MKTIDENYFQKNNNVENKKAEDFLDKDEKILWRGIPKKSCYVIQNSSSGIPSLIAIGWGVIDLTILFSVILSSGVPTIFLGFLIPFFAIHMTPTWIWIAGIVKASKKVFRIEYLITNKRIIEINGSPKYVAFSIDFEDIEDVKYKQSFIDKCYHVADIYINSENSKIVLFDVANGLFVYQKLEKIVRECYNEKKEQNRRATSKTFYKQNAICLHCGSYFDSVLNKCPNCGAPKEEKNK